MKRRDLLITSASFFAAGTTGCLGSVEDRPTNCYEVSLEPVSREQLIDESTVQDAELDEPRVPPLLAGLVREIIEDGSGEVETTFESYPHQVALQWITHYEKDSEFYVINKEPMEEGEVTGPKYEIRRDEETPDDASSDNVLVFDELPRCDQLRLSEPFLRPLEAFHGEVDRSAVAGYLGSDTRSESVLADGVDAGNLQIGDGYAELKYDTEETTTAKRFQYTSELVAKDREAFGEYVDVRLQQRVDEFGAAEQELLDEAATNGRVDVCDTDGSRYEVVRSIEDKMSGHEPESDGPLKHVRYDGEWYRIEMTIEHSDY